MFATALRAEGHPFKVFTPAGGLRLASERSAEDYIELALDTADQSAAASPASAAGAGTASSPPSGAIRRTHTRDSLTEEDVLQFLLGEMDPFVGR